MAVFINKKENKLIIKFDYSPSRVEKIKTFRNYKWVPEDKSWTIPFSENNLDNIKQLFKGEKVQISFEDDTPNSDVIAKLREELILKGYSFKTRKLYLGHIKRFSSFAGKKTDEVEAIEIRKYITFLLENQQASHTYTNQAIIALKFLYNDVLKQNRIIETLPRPKKEKKLPNILSPQEVLKILNSIQNEKHRTILFLVYSAGLRVGEVVRLNIGDIDSSRMLIHINQGKGGKDRYTLLSEVALNQLRRYYKQYKPETWLFPGGDGNGHLTERTVQKIFEDACAKSGINKKATVHTFRHSFATHLLEGGTDLRYIQELLGHSSSKTTEIYTHVTEKSVANIQSPLDRIGGKDLL